MLIIITLLIIVSIFSISKKPKCWRGGRFNSTSQKCVCPYAWKNIPSPHQPTNYTCESKSCCSGEGPNELNKCTCTDKNWFGVNCDLCVNDLACQLRYNDSNQTCVRNSLIPTDNMKYNCVVKEQEYIDLLGKRTTIQCEDVGLGRSGGTCYFQGWAYDDEDIHPKGFESETLWCNLYNCSFSQKYGEKTKVYCSHSWCECNTGELGSNHCDDPVIKNIVSQMRHSATVECEKNGVCEFNHKDFFAEIFMHCEGNECVHEWKPPPPSPPEPPNYFMYITLGVGGLIFLAFLIFFIVSGSIECKLLNTIKSEYKELNDFGQCGGRVDFIDLNYYVKVFKGKNCYLSEQQILFNVSHSIKSGEVVALMGASGAGKTSLLDILCHRNKSGVITGKVLFNNKEIDSSFRRMTGYVLQEDCLLSTMTVKECIRFSADLKLPSSIPSKVKSQLVDEMMKKLNIFHIRNRKIGDQMKRGISGGERKRVSVATELIINPLCLFLDEPTSGLDATSAFEIVKLLVNLSRKDGRTMIFSIHQPRSNIFELFDKLILLSKGRIVYSGKASKAVEYFEKLGFQFPKNSNPADWLIDVISEEEKKEKLYLESLESKEDGSNTYSINEKSVLLANEVQFDNDKELKSESVIYTQNAHLEKKAQNELIKIDEKKIWKKKMVSYANPFYTQIRYLSIRAFKNFCRNFYLMPAHFLSAIVMGLILGFIYYDLSYDLIGCTNRMGIIFFMNCLLSFTAMSSLEVFIKERPIYVRERANGYYYPMSYYISKIFFDIIPLRVFPPIIMSSISYYMIGLHPEVSHFFIFIGLMVLFNIVAGAMCIMIGTIAPSVASANFIATISILYSALFGGFVLNSGTIPAALRWLKYFSYWNYAFEAFLINELLGVRVIIDPRGFHTKVKKDGDFFIHQLYFSNDNLISDTIILCIFAIVLIISSGLLLQFSVKERR